MIATLLAVIESRRRSVVFEPFYENYGPDTQLCGRSREFVTLRPPDWRFDPDELRRAFSPRTKAIILNSPNNPTGQGFHRAGTGVHRRAVPGVRRAGHHRRDLRAHHLRRRGQHIPMMTLPGMRDRTILINSMSKTYSVTGWRVGWVLAAPDLTDSIRKVHDFLTVGAAAPLQEAGVVALWAAGAIITSNCRPSITASGATHRDQSGAPGFAALFPHGAYYVMTDVSGFGFPDDVEFVRHLIRRRGSGGGSGFELFCESRRRRTMVRFCFCKKYETLEEARQRLAKL